MKFLLFILFSVLMPSCDSQKNTTEKSPQKLVPTNLIKKENAPTKVLQESTKKQRAQLKYDKVKKVTFDEKKLPKDIKFKGEIVSGLSWEDKLGLNYLIFSKIRKKNEDTLYINHFRTEHEETKLVRELKEYSFCDRTYHDIDLRELSFSIEDLDNDNIGEATFGYTVECEDGFAAPYKLFVLKDGKKYKLTGTQKIKNEYRISGKIKGPSGKFEANKLVKSHPIFLKHLTKRWEETREEAKDAQRFGHSASLVNKTLTIDGKEIQLPKEFVKNNLCLGAQRDFNFYVMGSDKQVLHINALNCQGEEDPPNGHLFVFVDEPEVPSTYIELPDISFPRFTGKGEVIYEENDWAACYRIGAFKDNADGIHKGEIHDRILRFDAKKNQLVQVKTQATKKSFHCSELAACPFVYIIKDSKPVYVGEILRNIRSQKQYTLQSLKLPKNNSTELILHITEEKNETTYLDEIYIIQNDTKIYPESCKTKIKPAFCKADKNFMIMKQGDKIPLTFTTDKSEIETTLWARGYYLPNKK